MEKYDVIIVGAGPAGLFATINLPKSMKVLLLEKNNMAGKKFLMSGSGRCNITHAGDIKDFFNNFGDNGKFLKKAFYKFNNKDTVNFFEQRGLKMITNENGKIFPITQKSKDVLDIMINECKNAIIKLNESVLNIEKEEEKFLVKTKLNNYIADNVIITTGGKSYPSTGSSGDGYKFAKNFSHTLIKIKPALASVDIENYIFSDNAGISLKDVTIYVYRDDKKIKEKKGDILFTHSGLSGPVILDNSRYLEIGDVIKVNIINKKHDEFLRDFIEIAEKEGSFTIKKILKNYNIPDNIIKTILDKNNINSDLQIANINKKIRAKIIQEFCEHSFIIEKIGNYNNAMVTSGGVSLKEINPNTMESKLVKKLYFAGEVMDIDGDTGGYNIQAAFSTGYLAALDIKKNIL